MEKNFSIRNIISRMWIYWDPEFQLETRKRIEEIYQDDIRYRYNIPKDVDINEYFKTRKNVCERCKLNIKLYNNRWKYN